jgi:predicted Rossmann fold nucleotide-binding protein DprA/Smf involved in DNA uptake
VDDVIDLAQVPAPQTMSALTMLEIRGMVQKAGANRYALADNIKT